jgi:hypothetical protein
MIQTMPAMTHITMLGAEPHVHAVPEKRQALMKRTRTAICSTDPIQSISAKPESRVFWRKNGIEG